MKKSLLTKFVAFVTMLSLLLTACGGGDGNGETKDGGDQTTKGNQTTKAADSLDTGGDADSGDTIKIGLVTPLTGTLAFGSNEVKNAMELAVEKHLSSRQKLSLSLRTPLMLSKPCLSLKGGAGVKYFIGGYGTC